MKHKRRLAASVACLVLLGGAVAQATTVTPAADPSALAGTRVAAAQLAAGATQVAGVGPNGPELEQTTIADLLSLDVAEVDARSIVTRVADLIRARTGRSPVVAAPMGTDEDGGAEPNDDERFVAHAAAGDLDGDGSADTVEYDVASRSGLVSIEVHAVSGATGSTIWTRRPSGADAALGIPLEEDVTGDGRPDLLSLAFTIVSTSYERDDCAPEDWECPFSFDGVHRWTLSVISGVDGRLAWHTITDGDLHVSQERTSGPIEAVALETSNVYRVQAANLYVLPFLADDHDGDGLRDLVVTTVDEDLDDRRSTMLLDRSSSRTVRNASHLEIRSAVDGRTLATEEVARGPVTAIALPAGHTVGSAAPDLMWERYVQPDRSEQCTLSRCTSQGATSHVEVAMVDGATMEAAWTITRPSAWVETLLIDVDDDGSDDVFLSSGSPFGDAEGTMLSGRDGRSLWQAPGYGGVFATPELDGAPGRDVILIEVLFDADGFGVRLERRVGSSGAQLASSTHRMDMDTAGISWLFLGPMGDADGDGVDDLAVGTISATQLEEGGEVEYRSRAIAESGRSAETIRTWAADRPMFLVPVGDADADGRSDAMVAAFAFGDQDEYTVTADVVRVTEGGVLWSTAATGTHVFMGGVGDQDGDGGTEVLVSATGSGGSPLAKQVQSHRGSTGALRWSRSD